MLEFKYMPTTNARQFSSKRRNVKDIKFIVIHDTANTSRGANAMAHYKYLNHAQRYGSAHYYVDDTQIIQTIGDSRIAWAVGDTWASQYRTRSDVTNENSLSVEMCINSDGNYQKTWSNTVELVKNLLLRFPQCIVIRHFDATGKPCPSYMRKNDWDLWYQFLRDIKTPRKLDIDLSQSSVAKVIEEKPKICPTCGQVIEDKKEDVKNVSKTELVSDKYLNIIKTTSDNVYQCFVRGQTLRKLGAYGINGTFFDTRKPFYKESIWGIAVNNGSPIGPNADRVDYDKNTKRGTLCIDYEGNVSIQVVNDITEIKPKPKFAVSGLSLYPVYNPTGEKIAPDILRRTWHTAIAYKGKEIYLITSKTMCDMVDFKNQVQHLGIDGAVALDGGGSSEFYYKGAYQGSGRALASIIGVRIV